jgi:soluble lytic murein transglycosylase-like protein
MLLASFLWVFPTPVHAQTNAQTETQEATNQEPYGPRSLDVRDSLQPLSQVEKTVPEPTSVPVNKKIRKPVTPQVSVYGGRHYSPEEVQTLIIQYSQQYGISPDLPLRVANCESGFNQFSANKSSSARGVAQYLASTWKNTEAGRAGLSVMDADANVHMMVKSIASGGISNWSASKSCWSK